MKVLIKKAKIGLETYIGGQQERPENIVTAMANLEAHLAFMEDFDMDDEDNKPLLVQMLRKIADIITSQKIMKFVDKYNGTYPWISHTLLVYIQMIFAEFATIARNNKFIVKVLKQENIPSSAYDRVQEIFRDCVRDLTKAANLQSYLAFQTKPGSFVSKKRPSSKMLDSGILPEKEGEPQIKKPRYDTSRGRFEATGPFRFPINDRICNRYAQIASFCKEGSNCLFKHKIFLVHFNPEEQQKIMDYVASNKNISFAPHIKLDGLGSKNNTPVLEGPKPKPKSSTETAPAETDGTGSKG